MSVLSKTLTEFETSTLCEVANIGAGHAVMSLCQMTDAPFVLSTPAFGVRALSACADIVGDVEAQAAAVYMPVHGDAPGHVAFLFPFANACALADMLLGLPHGTTTVLEEMECSALAEVGNILISSFLNAISELTGLSLPASPPGVAIDMTGAILSSLAGVSPTLGDHALTIMTRLTDSREPVEGVFVYIPEPDSLPVLFQSLGVVC